MKKMLLLSSILALSAVWAVAQYGSQQPSASSQSSSDASKTTIEGCLAGSVGNYSLTDKLGTTYQLTGDTAKLQAHVGHTVQVTGTTSSAGATGGQTGSMSAPADTQPTLNVSSFKHISASCSATR
jgi:hypothetical protein